MNGPVPYRSSTPGLARNSDPSFSTDSGATISPVPSDCSAVRWAGNDAHGWASSTSTVRSSTTVVDTTGANGSVLYSSDTE